MATVGLSLLTGPANAGKVELLLERVLARIDDEPFLVVPNRADVELAERDLLARCGCLLGGSIGTFETLFRRIADDDPGRRRVAGDAERALLASGGRSPSSPGQERRSRALPASRDSSMRSSARSASWNRGCSTSRRSTASSVRSTAATAPSSTRSVSGIVSSSAGVRASASRVSSTPGTANPSSSTASRT